MNISRSIRRLTNIFLVLFVALSVGLVYWQVVVAQQVASNGFLTYTRQCTSDTAPMRGNIYDRNGVLLAYSVKSNSPDLCGYQRKYTADAAGLEGLIGYYIAPNLSMTGVEAQFDDYLSGRNGITELYNTVNKILHVPPRGDDIYLTIDSRIEKILLKNFPTEASGGGIVQYRDVYPTDRGSVMVSDPKTGEILGILSQPGYDPNCVVYCTLNDLYTDMVAKGYDKVIGCTAPCSLDQFQNALNNQPVLQQQGLSGNCEDHSNCNLIYYNYLNSDPEQPLIFRPTQDCYPPGSSYKTVTLMADLDSNAIPLQTPVFYNDPNTNPYPQHLQAVGPITVGSGDQIETLGGTTPDTDISNINPYTYHFPVNLAYGYSHSDNIIFAEAGVKVGTDAWLKYNHSLYINQNIPFDLPVKVSTVTPQKQANLCSNTPQSDTTMTVPNLAENSFGQGTDFVTPLQMMVINNTVADDGKLMRPSIIEKIVDPTNQSTLQTFNATLLDQPISATAAQGVRDAMYGVNECGSGSLTAVQLSYPFTRWSVVGKTGTAQVPGEDATHGGDSWFITEAPYVYQSDTIPRITITAMKEFGGEGAYANGPMLRDDYEQIFSQVLTDVPVPALPPGGSGPAFCNQTGLLQSK